MKDYTLLVYFQPLYIEIYYHFLNSVWYSPGCSDFFWKFSVFFNTDKNQQKRQTSHKLYFKDMRDQWKLRKLDEIKFHRGDNHSEVIDG